MGISPATVVPDPAQLPLDATRAREHRFFTGMGLAALLIERNPTADPVAIQDILTMSAKSLAPGGRNDEVGWGLVDPTNALGELDAKVARDTDFVPGKPLPAMPKPTAAATAPVTTR